MKAHRFFLLIISFYLIFIAGSASTLSKQSLGIAPQDEKYYKSDIIKCKEGSKKFTKAQLNDDFCDCPDGTDEPGTSACPEGKFYCRNAGHAPLTLFSSRVNDGICDCCDGSDEYNGKIKCLNTCWEAGKMARDKLKKKIKTYEEGVIIRKQETEKATQAIAKDEAELLKLKNEEKILKEHVQKLKELKEQIEKAEEQERLKKEKEERTREAENKANEQEKQSPETPDDGTKPVPDELPESLSQDAAKDSDDRPIEAENGHSVENEESTSHVVEQHEGVEDDDDTEFEAEANHDDGSEASSDHLIKQEEEKSDKTEDLSREELGRLVASRWTGENAAKQTNELDGAKEIEHENKPEIPESTQDDDDDDDDGYPSETDEDGRKYDEDEMEDENMDDKYEEEDHIDSTSSYSSDQEDSTDFSDTDLTTESGSSWLDKVRQTFKNVLQVVSPFKTPVGNKSDAARVRKEYDESSMKLSKIQSRISSLTDKLKHDFGMEKEFYSFYDRCFESKQNKYVYKVCPFKQASQVEGHSTTQLGQWDKFEDSYRAMQFSHGDRCWNGPDRSLKVRLRCGLKNELTDVDEPSRCEYVALLSTPAICQDEKLKELQHKLELMNIDQPQSHDEL